MITIPTIQQLYTSILSDLEAEMGANVPLFGKNFLRAFAAVQASKLWLKYKAIAFLQKNIFIDTADRESTGGTLERFGRVKLGRNPFPATAGQYLVQVTGQIGATIKANSTFKSNDDSQSPGKLFVLDNQYILVTGTDSITLRALEAGLDSKLSVSDELTATAPIANVNSIVVVLSESVEPLAAEDIEEYRRKGMDAYKLEPQGGAGSDYRLWAADAQGVQQSYPFAKTGFANEINLFVEATIADSIDGKGTPSGAILTEVESVVELDPDVTQPISARGRRPLGVFQVHYLPITPKNVDIDIVSFDGITPEIETLIFNAIKEATDDIRPFVSSVDILEEKNDILDKNKLIAIILNARPGSIFTDIILKIDGVPMSTYTFLNGNIPYLNSVNYI